jgi:cbb3-type cytochrome oxidase maturation protein
MEILYLMVPLGLVLVGFGLWAFFWAVGSGQFDDLDSPGWSVLDDGNKREPSAANDDASAAAAAPANDPGEEQK